MVADRSAYRSGSSNGIFESSRRIASRYTYFRRRPPILTTKQIFMHSFWMQRHLRVFVATVFALSLGGTGKIERYAVSCSTPPKGWLTAKDGLPHLGVWSGVRIDRSGTLTWNGVQLSIKRLEYFLKLLDRQEQPGSVVVLSVHAAAPCSKVRQVHRVMSDASICRRERRCGEGTGWRDHPGGAVVFP